MMPIATASLYSCRSPLRGRLGMDPQVLTQVQTAACVHARYFRCMHTQSIIILIVIKIILKQEIEKIYTYCQTWAPFISLWRLMESVLSLDYIETSLVITQWVWRSLSWEFGCRQWWKKCWLLITQCSENKSTILDNHLEIFRNTKYWLKLLKSSNFVGSFLGHYFLSYLFYKLSNWQTSEGSFF